MSILILLTCEYRPELPESSIPRLEGACIADGPGEWGIALGPSRPNGNKSLGFDDL